MVQYLLNLKKDFDDGLREFSEHPVKYTTKTIGDLVNDYWDMGVVVLGGFAWHDYGSEIFGQLRSPIFTAGLIAAIYGAREGPDRFKRNILAGASSFYYFLGRNIPDEYLFSKLAIEGIGIVGGALSLIIHDRDRRKKKKIRKSSTTRIN